MRVQAGPMKTLRAVLFPLVIAVGCSVGADEPKSSQATSYNLIDNNNDGIPDCLDLDNDNQCDIGLGSVCNDPLVDTNNDGIPEGLDLDCDGTIDVTWCAKPLVDTDNDGVPDALDLDCDGTPDATLPSPGAQCVPELVDANNDGVPEGIDTDCD